MITNTDNPSMEGVPSTFVVECKGENGSQSPAALCTYSTDDPLAIDCFELLEGSELSYNNWCDVDRALAVIVAAACTFNKKLGYTPYFAIAVKHGNPCGAGVSYNDVDKLDTIKAMIEGDKIAIFGGTVITNFAIDKEYANVLSHHCDDGNKRRLDVVVAPEITAEARDTLRRKNGRCRMLVNSALNSKYLSTLPTVKVIRSVRGGHLEQQGHSFVLDFKDPDIECSDSIKDDTEFDIMLAWAICARSNSNTVTIVKNGKLIGNGTGQQSRVDAAKLAISRAIDRGHDLNYASAVSDSFFPFDDGPRVLATAGVKTIFATRGSINDAQVAKVLNNFGVVFITLPDATSRGFYGH